jgi:AraC-like DNA-binding protein
MPDLAGTVILLAFLQGAVLCGVLAARRTDQLANRFLAALIGAVSAMLLLGYVNDHWGFRGHPHWVGLASPLSFLFGPLLYLYVAALTRPVARFDTRCLVHGLPFLAYVLYMLQVFYLKTGDEKLALLHAYLAGATPISFRLMSALRIVVGLGYVLASFHLLRRYAHKIEGYYSDLTRIDLRWLMAIVLANAAVWGIALVNTTFQVAGFGGALLRGLEQATQIGSALTIFLTGYVSLWQPELFEKALAAQAAEGNEAPLDFAENAVEPVKEPGASPLPSAPEIDATEPVPQAPLPGRPKYQRNRLDNDEAEEFVGKLKLLMEREQAYRDAALTLPVLADTVGATPHLLSQVLNVRLGRSFYMFVNAYRTEALMGALSDPQLHERGVLELAFEVGFNSKSTLNSFFKKHTGLTPTEFRRRALGEVARSGSVGSPQEPV